MRHGEGHSSEFLWVATHQKKSAGLDEPVKGWENEEVKINLDDYDYHPETLDTFYALRVFIESWKENERLVEVAADSRTEPLLHQTFSDADEFHFENREARRLHDEVLMPMVRYSTTVMLCTTLERELLRAVDNFQRLNKIPKQKLGEMYKGKQAVVEKANRFFAEKHGIKFDTFPDFQSIEDLLLIRNCIAHAAGDCRLLRKTLEVTRLVEMHKQGRYPRFFAHPLCEISLEHETIDYFLRVVWRLFLWLFDALAWKVDVSYRTFPQIASEPGK